MSWKRTVAQFALAAGAVLVCAGCSGRKEVALANKDETIRKQETLLAQERADKQKLMEANDDLAKQNTALVEKNGVIAAKTAAEMGELRKHNMEIEAIMREMDKNIVALKSKEGLKDGQAMGFEKDPSGAIRLTVAGSALFDSGKADLKTSSHSMLANVCKTIKSRFPGNFIRVEGHTDSTPVVHNKGKYPDNMALSIARSRAVYDFMMKEGGIAAGKMYTAGYGEFQPLVRPEKTASDRAKNRRVEIVIMPNTVKVEKEPLAASK